MGIPLLLGGLALGGVFNGDKKPPPPPPSSSGQGTNAKAEQVKAASQATHDSTMEQGDTLGQTKKAQAAAAAQGTAYRDTSKDMGII